MRISKINKKINMYNWEKGVIENILSSSGLKYKNISLITEDTICIDNIDRKLVKNNLWIANTDMYDSKGSAPYSEVTLEKTANGITKSVFNVFLENVFPYDNIKNSLYKAIRAMSPKEIINLDK